MRRAWLYTWALQRAANSIAVICVRRIMVCFQQRKTYCPAKTNRWWKREEGSFLFYPLIRLMTKLTISSLSSGLLCATSRASATSALSLILSSPDFLNRCLFFSRNHTNKKAPILLFPSVNGWFLITKYSRCAACASPSLSPFASPRFELFPFWKQLIAPLTPRFSEY